MTQPLHTEQSGQTVGTAIHTGYYHADIPGRKEPYLITIDTQSHAVDFH